MFKIGDVVEYVGDDEARTKSDMIMFDWHPPTFRTGLFVIESVSLNRNDSLLRNGYELYKIFVRGTMSSPSRSYQYVVHTTDMYWDFELRKV